MRFTYADKTDVTFTCYAYDCWMRKWLEAQICWLPPSDGRYRDWYERIAKVIAKPINKDKYARLAKIAHKHGIEVGLDSS